MYMNCYNFIRINRIATYFVWNHSDSEFSWPREFNTAVFHVFLLQFDSLRNPYLIFCFTLFVSIHVAMGFQLQGISYVLIIKYTLWHWRKAIFISLEWRNIERDGVSNHRCPNYLLSRLFQRRSKKTSKLRVTGFCEGNPPMAGGFPLQKASNAKKISIWWCRHHVKPHKLFSVT